MTIRDLPEWQEYAKEHVNIFGHLPIPNERTGQLCCHEMHQAGKFLIEADGVDIEVPFDDAGVYTEDDEEVYRYNVAYQSKVDFYREWIAAEEEKMAWEERRRSGKRDIF